MTDTRPSRDHKKQKREILLIAGLMIAFIILTILAAVFFLSPSNLYRMKIKEFKAERPEKYAFLPDSFPEGSSDREYFYLPNIMQGQGYLMISFTVDDPGYIRSVRDKYTDNICTHTYDRTNGSRYENVNEVNSYHYYDPDNSFVNIYGDELTGWVNDNERYFDTPIDHNIENIKGTEMLLTYEYASDDPDAVEKGGIVIDDANSRVYFWIDN